MILSHRRRPVTQAIPVNRDVLKWARETSGLSIPDVARRLNKDPNVILCWEKGDLSPTYPQLEKLAYEIYKRPAAVFFFPVIPQESAIKADFRTLPQEVVDDMPPEIIKIYRKAKVYQLNLEELDTQTKPEPLLLDEFKLTNASNIAKLAKEIRAFLKLDLQTQIEWKNLDDAIDGWRNVLTTCGIYLFKDAFKNDNYSGLSLYDEKYPVIILNNSMSKARQIFSIFHELAHLLRKSGGIDILKETFNDRATSDYQLIEQKCNEFAGEFLLPKDVFLAERLTFSERAITELADHFKVSREVVLRKYLDANLIDDKTYKSFTDKWLGDYFKSRQRKKDDDGGNPYYTKKSYLGMYYINLAFSQYYQGKINAEMLADYLGEKVGNLSTFEGYVLR